MTLLSDIVKALHAAELSAYSVHSSMQELPGDPDLVVTIAGEVEEEVADALSWAELPISAMRQVGPGVLHVWQRQPSD
jgi:hypothetical protein